MLKQRVLTALAMLAVIVGAYFISPIAFAGVMGVAFMLAMYEWLKLSGLNLTGVRITSAVVGLITLLGMWYFFLLVNSPNATQSDSMGVAMLCFAYVAFVAVFWLGLAVRVFMARHTGMKMHPAMVCFTALAFAPAAWISFLIIYAGFGLPMVLSVLFIVWIADVMAYFAGRAFGKRRLAPALSPKKSWEGVAGGMLSVIAAGFLCHYFVPYSTLPQVSIHAMGPLGWVIVAVVLTALSIIGDLFESAIKRQAGVKDSGTLLPGHGGFYDRLDAMMPTLPVALVLLALLTFPGL